jgi:2-hydroxychromene-2-carboxylate isomerase
VSRLQVSFYFSPGSRYSYLAASQISALERETGCWVDWLPVHGGDIRAKRGRDPFVGDPVSGQYEHTYRQRDASAWARYYGIPFREPPADIDFRLLVRAAESAKQLGFVASYGWELARSVYGSEEWPIDESLCVRVAERLEVPIGKFRALLYSPEIERSIMATADAAHARRAFGVPTFFFGDQMFWGNDRIPLLRHALREARSGSDQSR